MQTYIVHYAELGLKGHNRIHFERRLVRNIRRALGDIEGVEVKRFHSYILVSVPGNPGDVLDDEMILRLQRIFGIAYLAPVRVIARDLDTLSANAVEMTAGKLNPAVSFRITASRGDKQYPMKSFEVGREVGAAVVAATQARVDLKHPDVTVNIQIYEDAAYMFVDKIPGPGGLPVGVSGNVLALFSGGIDSPVAANMLLKRGCHVDFLHFHLLPNEQKIRSAKIVAMANAVLSPHRYPGRLYMVSAAPFETAIAPVNTKLATVVFRRFIMRVASKVAVAHNIQALITGESVGQVASQTLTNISVINDATTLPVLRPLIGMDKHEIIMAAQQLGTYDLSIQPYRDPCSMHAKRVATHARLEDVRELEAELGIETLVEETLARHMLELHLTFDGESVEENDEAL